MQFFVTFLFSEMFENTEMQSKMRTFKNYWKIKDQWIVIEGSPHPDDFIAILAPGWDGQTLVDHSLYPSKLSATGRARYLMDKFEAKKIKIFYPDGRSKTLR